MDVFCFVFCCALNFEAARFEYLRVAASSVSCTSFYAGSKGRIRSLLDDPSEAVRFGACSALGGMQASFLWCVAS